jgi:ketosteroid isomerase-like protein
MRMILLSTVVAVAAAGCWAAPARVDRSAEAAAVRTLNFSLNAAIQRRDLATVVSAYAPGGALLWQDDPRLSGPQIREAWAQAFGVPGFALRLHSHSVTVSRAADLALDEGSLELELPGPNGIVKSPGKYLVVWQKQAGAWKILYDVYNMDPAPKPTAAPQGK